MRFNPNNDTYNDYFFVMENTMPQDRDVKVLDTNKSGSVVNYIRFEAVLQDFPGTRNRNKRLWKKEHVQAMLNQPHIHELLKNGSFVGENGHPTGTEAPVTAERILQIDPNNTSHRIVSFDFKGHELRGVIETLDQGPDSPGMGLMKNIIQGINPGFSLRSMVPQRRNADGTVDVTAPGRAICYDRVYVPGHEKAYKDISIPVKEIVTASKFDVLMESFSEIILSGSDKINRIIDGLDPVMESMSYNPDNGYASIKVDGGSIIVKPEVKFQNEYRNILNSL